MWPHTSSVPDMLAPYARAVQHNPSSVPRTVQHTRSSVLDIAYETRRQIGSPATDTLVPRYPARW
eukprot:918417-Rhodomonas_salina.1